MHTAVHTSTPVCGWCGRPLTGSKRKWCSPAHRAQSVRRDARVAERAEVLEASAEVGANRLAAAVTVEALRDLGRLEVVDSAQVTAFLELASAVDVKPTDAGLWREYRAAEGALRGVGAGADPDAAEQFIRFLNDDGATQVRDAAEG